MNGAHQLESPWMWTELEIFLLELREESLDRLLDRRRVFHDPCRRTEHLAVHRCAERQEHHAVEQSTSVVPPKSQNLENRGGESYYQAG